MGYQMLVLLILILFVPFKRGFSQKQVEGYYVSFGCCFNKDSVKIYFTSKNILYESILDTNPSSGICDSAFFFLQSSKQKRMLNLMFNKKILVKIRTKRVEKLMYIYLYKKNNIYAYAIRDKVSMSQ